MTSYYKNGIKRLTKKALIAVLLGGRKMKQAWRNLGVIIGVVKKRAKKFVEAENVELKREVRKNYEEGIKNQEEKRQVSVEEFFGVNAKLKTQNSKPQLKAKNVIPADPSVIPSDSEESLESSTVIPASEPESSGITTPTDDAGSRVKPGMTEGGVWNGKRKRKVSVEEFFKKNQELRSKDHEDETASDSSVIPARACPPNWRKPESNEILNQVQDDNYDARDDSYDAGDDKGGVWNDKKKTNVSVEEFFNKNQKLRSKNHEDETASDSAVIPANPSVIPSDSEESLGEPSQDSSVTPLPQNDKGGPLNSEFLASPTGGIIHDSNDDPEYSISAYVKNLAKKIFLEITAFVFYFLATLYKQIEPGLKSVWKVLEKYAQKFWEKFAQTELGAWFIEKLEPWARFFNALLKFLMRKVVALNTVQKVTAALVILAMLWTNGLFAFAQEGDPMDRISTPEIRALQTVNPELLHSDNQDKEKEIEKVIEQEEQKINYTFGGLVPDSDEDKVKKEEVKILQEVKDNLRGGVFVGPKSVEYTVLKFTKSYHPRVKQAAKNVQELLQNRGLFETIADYQTGEEKELSTKLDYERGKIKPGSVPFNIDIDGGFIGGMRIGDISDQAEIDQNSESQPTPEATAGEARITNQEDETASPTTQNQELGIKNQEDETASDSSVIPAENTVIPAPEPESTTWIPDQVGNDRGVEDETASDSSVIPSSPIVIPSENNVIPAPEPESTTWILNQVQDDSGVEDETATDPSVIPSDSEESLDTSDQDSSVTPLPQNDNGGSLNSEFIIHDSNEEDEQDAEQSSDNQNETNKSNTTYAFTPKTYKIDTQDGEKFLIDKTPEHQESIEFIPVGANETSGITADNKVLFRNAWQGMDVLKTVTQQGVKEDIIIKNNSASTKVEFEVKTTGLQMRIVEGGLQFYDIFGNLKFETPAPFMVDRYGNAKNLEYKLVVDSPVKKVRVQNENQAELDQNQELRIKNHEDETASDSSVIPSENTVIPAGVYPPNWRKPESGEILNQVQDDSGGVGSDKREDETASDSVPADPSVIPSDTTVIPASEPESSSITTPTDDAGSRVKPGMTDSDETDQPISWLQRSTNVILSVAKDLGSLKNKIIAKVVQIPQSLRSFTMTVEGVFSYSLGKIKMAIASDSAEASPDKQDEDQAELDQNQELRIKNQEDDETTNGTADTTVIPAENNVIPAPEPESTTWIPGQARDDNEILNQVQDDNGGVGNDSYDARDDSGGTLDSEFIIHDSSGGSRQTKPIIDPNDTRNQIVQSIGQNDGSQNELTVFDDAVHQVAEIFGQGPQWVLSIFSDSQIQSILDMQAQLTGGAGQTEVAQKDGKKLVLPEGWSDEILTSITEERTYKVVIELDFTGLSFPIDLDPTTYINLQDKGQVTFHADFSDGSIYGNEGYMSGYGVLTRGNEPVQIGGTRVENTSSSITFVDPDGRRIAGKTGTSGVALATNSPWTYNVSAGFSNGSGVYFYPGGMGDVEKPSYEKAYIEYAFAGTEIWAGLTRNSVQRVVEAVVDEGTSNEIITYIDLYKPVSQSEKMLIATDLSDSSHTVRIYPQIEKNIASSPAGVNTPPNFDFFEYYTSGNELAQKSSITINERATAGFNFLNSKDSPAISYSASGNVPQSDGGTEERGSFSTWISPDFDWNADNVPHYIWGDENQRVYYQYDSVGASGTFNYEIYNGSNWSTVRVESDEFSVASGTFSAGDVFHIATTWDASTGSALYVNNDKNTHSGSWTAQTVSGSFKFGGDQQTKLLLHADGANNATDDIDSSGNGASLTFNGDAKVSTASSTFGGASYYFDGTGDYILVPDSESLTMDGDFTIDMWLSPSNITGDYEGIMNTYRDNSEGFIITTSYGTNGQIAFYTNGAGWYDTGDSLSINQWQHLAVVRNGTNMKAYLNGVEIYSWTDSSTINSGSGKLYIGYGHDAAYANYSGYIDEIRITKGFPRWTSDFAPPDSAGHSNMIITEPTLFNYVLTDSEVKNIYSSTVSMGRLIGANTDSTNTDTNQNLFSVPKRSEETNQTAKSLLFNFPGVQTADSKVGSFGGSLYKTSAPTNPSTTVAEADVTFEGSWTDNGNLRYTTDSSSYATYTTAGAATEIWAGVRASTDRAIAEYIIDEGTAKEVRVKVDQYASSATDRYYLLATGLESATHTIKVRPLGIRNPSSSGNYIIVGIVGTADRMFYYGTTGDIATQDMVVNGQTINNVLEHDYATMPNAIQFTDKGNISESAHEGTISAWVQTSWAGGETAQGNFHWIFSTLDSSAKNGIWLQTTSSNGNIQFGIANASANVNINGAINSTNWPASTPHHLVAKWWRPTSTTMGLALYLDGVKLAENKSQTLTPTNSTGIMLGNYPGSLVEDYDADAAIYDLSVWSWAFDDGGATPGEYVVAESEVWQSWKGRALLAQEDLSSQVDGTATTFKLLRGGLQTDYTNTYDSYTKLLIHSNTTDGSTTFIDSSLSGHSITAVDTIHHETDAQKFGATSIYADGAAGDSFTIADSDDFDFSGGVWTIDCWVNISTSGDERTVFYQETDDNNFIQGYRLTDNNIKLRIYSGGVEVVALTSTGAEVGNTAWHHIAFVENGDSYAIYVDGTSVASTTDTDRPANYTGNFRIGYSDYTGQADDWYGYIDEYRVSNGVARWTSGFSSETTFYSIASSSANSLTSSMSVKDDGSLATVSSVASGTFALASGSFDFDDTSIVVDNLDDENSIDTNGGYLTVGQPGANWQREIVEYSSYNAGTNTFTVSARGQKGTFATSWADNTPIEIGGTITLSSAPEEDSILLADYYYTGSEFDRDRGQIKSKQNRLNFLDYTDSASTGWDLTGYSAYNSGGQRMATQVAGQNAFGYFYGSDLGLVFYGDGTNGGVAEFIIDEGTKDQRRVLIDQNDSNGSQAFLQVVAGLSAGYHTFRMIGGVAETNAGSNKYTTFDAVIFGGKTADLGQPTGNVGGDEYKDSNYVNDILYWPAWEDFGGTQETIILSGTLSGYYDYSEYDVVIGNVTVSAYTGSGLADGTCDSGDTGCLEINAKTITVTGTINASGAGYGGGGAGGGGGGGGYPAPRGGDVGPAGGGTAGGSNGSNGSGELTDCPGAAGGNGGAGGGGYGGSGGSGGAQTAAGADTPGPDGNPGSSGSKGGYATAQGQGDSSTDESLLPGSGGGGGGGGSGGARSCGGGEGNNGGGGGGAGGAGNSGGGFVKLYASEDLKVSGAINTTGKANATGNGSAGTAGVHTSDCCGLGGNGGTGGSAFNSGTSIYGAGGSDPGTDSGSGAIGGSGGAGAGGGVLLKAPTVSVSGSIDTRGGGNDTANGGTLKVFYDDAYDSGTYSTGRTYATTYTAPTSDTAIHLDADITGEAISSMVVDSASTSSLDFLSRPAGVIQIGTEYIKYETFSQSGASVTFQGITRGYSGTTAASHSSGDTVTVKGGWRDGSISQNWDWFEYFGAFPERPLLSTTGREGRVEGNLSVVNLDGNTLWGRFEAGASNAITSAPQTVAAVNGKVFAGFGAGGGGLAEIDFMADRILRHKATAGVGYGSATGTKGLISQANDAQGWSYTSQTGVALIGTGGDYVNDVVANYNTTSSTYDVWVAQGKKGTTGTSAGVSYVFDSLTNGLLDTAYDLTADTGYWVSAVYYDADNDDLYIAQTKGTAGDDIWSKISNPRLTADSSIDTADGSDRVASASYTFEITGDANNVYFATADGVKKVSKSSFSSGVTDTFNANDYPELADGNDSYTKLLLHGDGYSSQTFEVDYSASQHELTFNGDAELSTDQKKFGVSSLRFDGTGDYVSVPDSDDWNFGSGDFTVDFWVNFSSLPSVSGIYAIAGQYVDGDNYGWLWLQNNGGTLRWMYEVRSGAASQYPLTQDTTLSTNTWYHIAIVRSGNSWYCFQNGQQVGATGSNSVSVPDYAASNLIGVLNSGYYLSGYLDELRISKGIARWTSNFTPPTEPHQMPAMSVDYSSELNRLINTFSGMVITTNTAGGDVNYYDSNTETDLDRNNNLSGSYFNRAIWTDYSGSNNGFAAGGDEGITLGVWEGMEDVGDVKSPGITVWGGFMIF